jgi:hypothetical protein
MKKFIFVSLLCLSEMAAAGPYASVAVENSENQLNGSKSNGGELVVGNKWGDGWQGSFKLGFSQPDSGRTRNLSENVELRIKKTWKTDLLVNPYLGTRLGEKFGSTSNFSYYALDVGIVVPIGTNLDFDASYRYRNAFETYNNYETDRYGLGVGYKVTKDDKVSVTYYESYGDSETDSMKLQYTRSF